MKRPAQFGLRAARLFWITAVAAMMASAQGDDAGAQLAVGKVLVARRDMADPNFAETVILLVQHDEKGTVGLILNRQTKVPISRLAGGIAGAKGRTDPLYLGGPVETSGVMALVRSRNKPEDAKHLTADLYMISSKPMLEKAMASGAAPSTLRLYLGYAGWDEGQLEWELGMDAWDVLPPDAGLAFDPHPETLWSRLVERGELQMALARHVPFIQCALRGQTFHSVQQLTRIDRLAHEIVNPAS
jgi:putative AlgH/UPF0301 family transcriptional regulator